CVTVVKTPYARVFGWPNSLFGICYYLALIVWTLFPAGWLATVDAHAAPLSFLIRFLLTAASTVTVVLGGYLVYALREKLHTDCPLCYLAHAINAVLLVLVILTAW
ncbi:MAG TPA: vitamin K epoxide reductase family protein, partial [Terriglobia bacterium]|nr:vitamin K epoxide reductase family protein [Terriglobia bacterium]